MPCGRVPAGISTQMTLKFMPVVNKDFHSHLKLLSETGMVMVPIEILSKKCVINLENPVINFGTVILGQNISNALNVSNSGALECTFSFLDNKEYYFSFICRNKISIKKRANITIFISEIFYFK